MKKWNLTIIAFILGVGLSAVCLGFANSNRPVQDDPQGIGSPELAFGDQIVENWSDMLDAARLGVTSAITPAMALADLDPDNPIPDFGTYPHLFKDGDSVSFTMLDRALSQQELVRGQQQMVVEMQAHTSALLAHTLAITSASDAITAAVGSVQAELVAGRSETARIATHVQSLATNGVTLTQDNSTLITALQQLITTLQTGQTF